MVGGTKMATLTGKRQQLFMTAVFAFHAGKAVGQVAAVEITIIYRLDIGPPEAVLSAEVFVINLHEGFKIILDAMIIIRLQRATWLVCGCRQCHFYLAG